MAGHEEARAISMAGTFAQEKNAMHSRRIALAPLGSAQMSRAASLTVEYRPTWL
jgi:hypothetical protein